MEDLEAQIIIKYKRQNQNKIRRDLSDEEILLGTKEEIIKKNKAILQKYFN